MTQVLRLSQDSIERLADAVAERVVTPITGLDDPLITKKQAQELLGCGATFLHELISAGEFRITKYGERFVRLYASDVLRWREKGLVDDPSA